MKIKTALLLLGLASLSLADNETTPREKSRYDAFALLLYFLSLFIVRTDFSVQHRPVPQ